MGAWPLVSGALSGVVVWMYVWVVVVCVVGGGVWWCGSVLAGGW